MQNLLKASTRPLYRRLLRAAFRSSSAFVELQQLHSFTPQEAVLNDAIDFAKWSALEGDYLEFGVYEGKRLSSAFHLARRNDLKSMRFYAFDSFQGLPPISGVDARGFRQFEQGEYSCDVESFKRSVAANGVDMSTVDVVPGWYRDVLNEATKARLPIRAAAVIWVDCDLYESTVPVLDFVTDYVQDGTVIVFDDWFCFRGRPDRGEQRAFREWLEAHPDLSATEFHKYGWHGNSFIIHRG
jgi:O-methyltransferase